MPNLTDTVSSLDKRVTALETSQTQKDEKIIPLIEKLYRTVTTSTYYCGSPLSGTINTAGSKQDVIDDLVANADYVALGTGSTAVEGSALPNESYRKPTVTEQYSSTLVIDCFIENSEANGTSYTNFGLIKDGTSTSGTGTVYIGKSGVTIAKSTDKTLTISSEITVEELNHGLY